jgi:SAM-dependent methyltransferase
MTQDAYMFEGTSDGAELERLRMLEAVFDDKSQQWLRSAGPLLGRRCLEVGAGAGSIAAWLASEVGTNGEVVAVDANTRFLRTLPRAVEVIEGALGVIGLPAEHFDVVHARYVLIHNANGGAILDAMLQALKPGGALVLEEPDFSAATTFTGPSQLRHAFDNVKRAIRETFSARGMDYAFGLALPGLVGERPARLLSMEYDCPVTRGGTSLADMMRLSTLSLRDKYVATGVATSADIAGYAEFAVTPNCWGNCYATVRILAQKAES